MGADGNILSNLFLPFGKARMGCPTVENERGLMTITEETLPMTSARYRLSTLSITSAPT